MKRPAFGVGQQPFSWLLFVLSLRKCFKLRYLFILCGVVIISTYVCIVNLIHSDHFTSNQLNYIEEESPITVNYSLLNTCTPDETELKSSSLLSYKSNDNRPRPSIKRLTKLFHILSSHENKFRSVFDHLGIFRFNQFKTTLLPYANHTERLQTISCLFQQYIHVSNKGDVRVHEDFITYLNQISSYLSDGFRNTHLAWNHTSSESVQKPVIILAANSGFFETLQGSMRTVNNHLVNYTVAIYDLGFNPNQLNMIKENCDRCIIIPFPFDEIVSVAPHVQTLPNFAWKPIVIQDALRRFGSIIYGDTSIRYRTSNFHRLLVDNLIRGFSCRELPGHYLPCFTLSGTLSWFDESSSTFDDIYIAEAGFLAVNDNFLSRLILKTWVTCALDITCIWPSKSSTKCKRMTGSSTIHRYDQSAMVTALSFFFFPSPRENEKSDPAPYDMYTSIQDNIADVRRFATDSHYFTKRTHLQANSNVKAAIWQ